MADKHTLDLSAAANFVQDYGGPAMEQMLYRLDQVMQDYVLQEHVELARPKMQTIAELQQLLWQLRQDNRHHIAA